MSPSVDLTWKSSDCSAANMQIPVGQNGQCEADQMGSSMNSPSASRRNDRKSFRRLMEKLTPRRSRRSIDNDAMQQSCPDGSKAMNSKSVPRSSLTNDLRRSWNHLFQHSTKDAGSLRASSEHQLNNCKVESLQFEPDSTGIVESMPKTNGGVKEQLKISADNLCTGTFSSSELAKMTKPLTAGGAYLSDSNVFLNDNALVGDLADGPARGTPSYLRISCALSGYRRNMGRRCASSLSTSSASASPAANRLLCFTNAYSASPPLDRPRLNGKNDAGGRQSGSSTPLKMKEIIDGFDKLSLRDNSAALRLLASCREQRKLSVDRLDGDGSSSAGTGDQSDGRATAKLVYDRGAGLTNGQPMTVGPVEIVSNEQLLPALRTADYYKELAAFERYRLECLCNRLQSVDTSQLYSATKTQLVCQAHKIVQDMLGPFQTQLESGGQESAETLAQQWQGIADQLERMDTSLDVSQDFADDSVVWSEEQHGDLHPMGGSAKRDGHYYEQLAGTERARLEAMCCEATADLESCPCEEACDRIRMAVGKATLLLKKKFKKFEELVQINLEPVEGEPCVKLDDLDGFWSLVEIEMVDIESLFDAVNRMKENQWMSTSIVQDEPPKQAKNEALQQKRPPVAKKRWIGQKVTEARQRLREAKLLGKQRMKEEKNDAQEQSNGHPAPSGDDISSA